MSFRDLEAGTKGGAAAFKAPPKQRREDDSTYERSIKANILEIQDTTRRAREQLDIAQRSFMSRRVREALDRLLERSRDLTQETEQLFRDWTIHLAGEPAERLRKKFSFEKLQRAFEDEVSQVKDVSRRTLQAQQDAWGESSNITSMECRTVCEDQGSTSYGGEDTDHLLIDDGSYQDLRMAQEDVTLRNRIAQEREEGIRRIQSQVSEVNQIFRDLASIVHDQDSGFQTIEQQAETSAAATKQAVGELKKTVDRQKSSRESLCCLLGTVIIVLCFIILPHLRMEFHHDQPMAMASAAIVGSGAVSAVSAVVPASRPVAVAGFRSNLNSNVASASGSSSSGSEPVVLKKVGQSVK